MKKLLVLLLFIEISCESQNKYWDFLIRNYSNHHIIIVSNDNNDSFLVDTKFLKTDFWSNDKRFSKKNFAVFFYDLIKNRQADILPQYLKRKIGFDKEFYEEYKKKGFDFILRKYLIFDNKIYFTELKGEKLDTILLIMFENSYLISFSDYSGDYHFRKYVISN